MSQTRFITFNISQNISSHPNAVYRGHKIKANPSKGFRAQLIISTATSNLEQLVRDQGERFTHALLDLM